MKLKKNKKNGSKNIITTKKTKDGFWKSGEISQLDCKYNLVVGGRSNGKSTELREKVVGESWELERKFVVLFRNERKVVDLVDYFRDAVYRETDGRTFVKDITKGACDDITVKAGRVYLTFEGKNIKHIGYVLFLENYRNIKSSIFPDTYNLIYEEFIAEECAYLVNEPEKFDSLMSTIFRIRENVKFYLIGNKVSAVTPYTRDWGLNGLHLQEEGTIEVYEREKIDSRGEVQVIKIACEMTRDREVSMALSKKGQQSAGGKWEAKERPNMTREELEECDKHYEFVVTYGGFYFLLQLYQHKKTLDYFLYCERKTTEIKPNTRVIGDIYSMSNLYTKSFMPLVERERFVFNLIKEEKMFFCNDLTGEDFFTAYKSLLLMR